MKMLTRATRNITRRKRKTALVIAALSVALAILITLPFNITTKQASQKFIDSETHEMQRFYSQLNVVSRGSVFG